MPLTAGTRLGSYEVVAPLGAGGMGEVYRARDTKLNRDVALKILPEAFASDLERLARFEREAQLLATLNHQNIGAIYGLDESGGCRFLVLELVDGESLAQRLKRGPLPVAEALVVARQIVDALEVAHDRGIVHRDLKPANIMLTAEGQVKVLDFGLAKAFAAEGGRTSGVEITNSPTITSPMTQAGMILGTAAYMSPEQAKGRPTDKRSDVWAFGCVFFEMLTGKRAFEGEDVTDTLAAIVRGEPDWTVLPSDLPAHVASTIRRCLIKDRKTRIPDLSVVRFLTDEGSITAVGRLDKSEPSTRPSMTVVALALVGVAAVAALVTWVVTRPGPPTPGQPARFAISASGSEPIAVGSPFRDVVVSPDGSRIVYTTGASSVTGSLWVRAADQLEAVEFRGITAPRSPFVSPDSKWIGFYTVTGNVSEIKKVSMSGGPPITLCKITGAMLGASWGADDTIVFGTSDTRTGLYRMPAGGGEPQVLTTPDREKVNEDHVFPSFLLGGQALLLTISVPGSGPDNSQVAVLDLKTGQSKTLIRGGGQAEYVQSGHIVYAAAGSLRAVRFDPSRLEVLSDPIPVVENVLTKSSGAAEFSISREGLLLYVAGGQVGTSFARRLAWVDRLGKEEILKAPLRAYQRARLSPDGTRIALDVRDQESDIWTWDIAHETLTRVTFDPGLDGFPTWTSDSARIIFTSSRNGRSQVFSQSADGTGSAALLGASPEGGAVNPVSISPDNATLILRHQTRTADIYTLRLDGSPSGPTTAATGARTPTPLLQTPSFTEDNGVVSPDSRWLAYDSDESGQFEVHVRPFPNVNGGHWQVSNAGGRSPLWAPNGRELFYFDSKDLLTAIPVQASTTGTFNFGTPKRLLNTAYYSVQTRTFDVSRDGQKFLMIKDEQPDRQPETPTAAAPANNMVLVLNWVEELKARLPPK
ncbi:MAG: protein kinase domain-containing protein [Vicinamibacterales bacterium]